MDFSTLPVLERLERTPTGGVRIPANVSRVGVLLYKLADGTTRREYRPDSEAFAPRSLASLADAVVTVGHPPEALVTPATVRRHQVGHVRGAGTRADRFVSASLAVLEEDAIARIARRDLCELSSGYTCVIDATPGVTPDGESYDVVQRDVIYNHVALLPAGAGRAGPDVKLRIDGAEVRLEDANPITEKPTETRNDAMKETINGREYTVGTPEWSAANALRTKRLDELEEAAKEAESTDVDIKAKLDEITKERDELKAKVDELMKKLGESEDETKMDSKIADRARVLDAARRHLGADVKTDGKASDALRREVLVKLDGADSILGDDKKPLPPEHVRIAFDARMRGVKVDSQASPFFSFSPASGGGASPNSVTQPVDVGSLYQPPGQR